MRIFLDAHILFSAAKSAGAMRGFLAQLRTSGHTLVADAYVAGEARRNIEAKFPEAAEDFETLLSGLEIFTGARASLPGTTAPELTEKDRPVLAAAIQHRCHALVTGDKTHFGSLYGQSIEAVVIHSPASLASQLDSNSA
jgi:hypothetical protein